MSAGPQDAMRFPIIGSAVLFSLFLLFKFLPKVRVIAAPCLSSKQTACSRAFWQEAAHFFDAVRATLHRANRHRSHMLLAQPNTSYLLRVQELVNAVLTAYFVVLGTAALTATFAPIVELAAPALGRRPAFGWKGIKVPLLMSVSFPADHHRLFCRHLLVDRRIHLVNRYIIHVMQGGKQCSGLRLAASRQYGMLQQLVNIHAKGEDDSRHHSAACGCERSEESSRWTLSSRRWNSLWAPRALQPVLVRLAADCQSKLMLCCLQEPADIELTMPELIAGAASVAFCAWYYAAKHWLANNALGLAFSIQGIEHLSLGAVSTGAHYRAVCFTGVQHVGTKYIASPAAV